MTTTEWAVVPRGHLVPDPDDIYTDLDLLRERLLPLQNGERIAAREVGEWRLQIPDDQLGKTRTMKRWHALRWETPRGYVTSCGRSIALNDTLLRHVSDNPDMCSVCVTGLTSERWEPGR